MKIKSIVLLIGLMILIGCQSKYQLEEQPLTELKFDSLPNEIQKIYLKSIEPKEIVRDDGSTITIYGGESEFICLNPEIEKCEFEIKWFASFKANELFRIGNTVIQMRNSGNSINEPYVLLDEQLYFLKTKNVWSIDVVKNAEYGKYDLSEKLK